MAATAAAATRSFLLHSRGVSSCSRSSALTTVSSTTTTTIRRSCCYYQRIGVAPSPVALASRLGELSSLSSSSSSSSPLLLASWSSSSSSWPLLSSTRNESRRWLSSSGSYPPHQVVGMPSLSPTMESGTIASWKLSEGQSFSPGDILCEVETDKATVDFEAQDEGVLAKILVQAGPNEIKCGDPIMVVVDDEGDVAAFASFSLDNAAAGGGEAAAESQAPSPSPPPAPAPSPTPAPAAPTPAPATSPSGGGGGGTGGGRIVASPLAHTLAKQLGLGSLASLPGIYPGTGPNGRVVAADVREYVPPAELTPQQQHMAEGAAASAAVAPLGTAMSPAVSSIVSPPGPPTAGDGYTDYPLSPAALEIAASLTQSKRNVPHYYLTVDVRLDNLLEMRSSLNASLGNDGHDAQISVNDLLLKAAAAAMKTVPSANASWMGGHVRVYDSVDINVVLGSGDGLYAPVVKNCGGRGVAAISSDVRSAMSALEGEGTEGNHDGAFHQVGTVTVMNLGMYGIKSCAPIVREPQAVALALGAIENRIVPNEDESKPDEIYMESVMLTATLSCDHRVVDGAVGAQWLGAFKRHVENPATLLL